MERLVDSLKALQDVIGEHQDAVVAEARLRAIARAKTAIAAGRLIEGERAASATALARPIPTSVTTVLERGKKAF